MRTPFIILCSGKDWMAAFLLNNNLSLKKPSTVEKVRKVAAGNPWTIYEFYDILEEVIKRLNLHDAPGQIFNADESAFFVDPRGGKVVSHIGDNTKRVISGSGRTCFTVMACV